MGLSDPLEILQTWGSHQPLLRAVLEVLRPESAVECGCGDFSTPLLQEVPNLHTIEHDQRWARKVIKKHPPPPQHRWTVQSFRAKNPTQIKDLPPGEFGVIEEFYRKVADSTEPFDLLFVDTFTACRVPAVLTLGTKAEMVILHDLEPPSPEVYRWDLLGDFFGGWSKYLHRPSGQVGEGRHQIPWTGFCSRLLPPLEQLDEVVRRESMKLWGWETALEMI